MRRMILAGRPVEADRVEPVVAPWTGETLDEAPLAEGAQVEEAIAQASGARAATARLPTWRRAAILRALADRIEEEAEALADGIRAEAGKPIDLARGEVARAQETFRFAAESIRTGRGESVPMDAARRGEGTWALTERFPIGPVAAITPFNFPLNLVAHKMAPAFAAGCPVVLKPANQTPLTAFRLGELALEAGWPPEALSVLNMRIPEAEALVTDERLALLSFTGSDEVGWQLKAKAGRKRVLLELGGDAAVVVEPDAPDWDAMIRRIAFGAFAYAGQVCISVQRAIVHADVHDRFVDDLYEAMGEHVRVGDPAESGVLMSSVIDDGAASTIRELVERSEAQGARRLRGGHRDGRLFDPMMLVDVPPDSPLGCTEAFGPLVQVSSYRRLDEAFAQVNRSRYGLQAGIYTSDLRTARRAFEELEVGTLLVGEVPTFRVDHMPYGGIKDSGIGREGLPYSLREHTEERLLVMPTR